MWKPCPATPRALRRRRTPTTRNPLPGRPLQPGSRVPDGGRPAAEAPGRPRAGQPQPVRGVHVHGGRRRQRRRTLPLRGSYRPAGRLQALCSRAGRRGVPGGRGARHAGARRGRGRSRTLAGSCVGGVATGGARLGRKGAGPALGRSVAPSLNCEPSVRVAAVACTRGEGYHAAASSGSAL